MMVLIKIV